MAGHERDDHDEPPGVSRRFDDIPIEVTFGGSTDVSRDVTLPPVAADCAPSRGLNRRWFTAKRVDRRRCAESAVGCQDECARTIGSGCTNSRLCELSEQLREVPRRTALVLARSRWRSVGA